MKRISKLIFVLLMIWGFSTIVSALTYETGAVYVEGSSKVYRDGDTITVEKGKSIHIARCSEGKAPLSDSDFWLSCWNPFELEPKGFVFEVIDGQDGSAFKDNDAMWGPTINTSKVTPGTYELSFFFCSFADVQVNQFSGAKRYDTIKIKIKVVSSQKTPTMSFKSDAVKKLATAAAFTNTLTTSTTGTIKYTSSDTSVATVNSTTGKVTIKGAGTTTIKASAAATSIYKAASKSYTLTVVRAENKITAADLTRTYSASSRKLLAGASCLGDAVMSYTSSNSKISVSTSGIIKVPEKFYGTTTITVKSAATSVYKAAVTTFTLTVKPVKTVLVGVSNLSGAKLKITWTKDPSVSGYEILYSKHSKFAAANVRKTITDSAKSSYTTAELTKGINYYVKMRSYAVVNGVKIYSSWSDVKVIKITK